MTKAEGKKSIVQMVKFALVGMLNTVIDAGLFYVLIVAGIHKGPAQVCATGTAMCSSFVCNRCWTFHHHGKGKFFEILKFLVVNLVSMTCVILLTHLFYDIWHIEVAANNFLNHTFGFVLSEDLSVLFCKMCASTLSIVINFLGNKCWVFKAKN